VEYKGEAVSSTRIRAELARGNLEDANAMLGRPFGYTLEVVEGEHIGRTLGAPTLNQRFPPGFAVPKYGVYASQAFAGGEWRASVTNIGVRPCFGGTQLQSETHILAFAGDLYGVRVPVRLLRYLRGERRFASLEELKEQIGKDIKELDAQNRGNA
jgi:riboflavin kinase/FMN adenylyltransferase